MDSIIDLVIKYSQERKIIDRDVISFILELGISLKELEDYVTKITFRRIATSDEYLKPSSYLSFYRQIIVNETELKMLKDQFIFQGNISEFSRYFTINIYITRILLYELENAIALKKSFSESQDFESLFFKLWHEPENTLYKLTHSGIIYFFKEFGDLNPQVLKSIAATSKLYEAYYNISLHHRLSNINSLNDVISLIKRSDLNSKKEILKIFQNELIQTYLTGYDLTSYQSSPTLELLNRYKEREIALDNNLLTETLNSANELSQNGTLEERMKYGLTASKSELENLVKRIRKPKTNSPNY